MAQTFSPDEVTPPTQTFDPSEVTPPQTFDPDEITPPQGTLAATGNAFGQAAVRGVAGAGKGVAAAGHLLGLNEGMGIIGGLSPSYDMMREAGESVNRPQPQTAAEMYQAIARDPLYQGAKAVGDVAEETYPVEPQNADKLAVKAGGMAGGFLPMLATGPAAPFEMGAQSLGDHLSEDYAAAKKEGLTEEQAAQRAINRGAASGIAQATLFAALPKPLKGAAEKLLLRAGQSTAGRFVAGRVATAAEGAVLGTASQGAENVIAGRPVTQGTGDAALGLGALNLVLPPYFPKRAGEAAPAVAAPARPDNDELPPPNPEPATPNAEPPAPVQTLGGVPAEAAAQGAATAPDTGEVVTPVDAALGQARAEHAAQSALTARLQSAGVPADPTPEPLETLQAQLAAVKAGTKPALLVTPRADHAEVMSQLDTEGLNTLKTDVGTWVYPPNGLRKLDIYQAVARNQFGKLLGYGRDVKPAGSDTVLQTKTADGTPVQEEVVTPQTLPAAIEAGKAVAPDGTAELKSAQQVLAERKALSYDTDKSASQLRRAGVVRDLDPAGGGDLIQMGGQNVGWMKVNDDGVLEALEIKPPARRQGVASAVVNDLARIQGSKRIKVFLPTEQGRKFFSSLGDLRVNEHGEGVLILGEAEAQADTQSNVQSLADPQTLPPSRDSQPSTPTPPPKLVPVEISPSEYKSARQGLAPGTAVATATGLAKDIKRRQLFDERTGQPGAKTEPYPVAQSLLGDTVKVGGQPMTVADHLVDHAGQPAGVKLTGAYGEVTVPPDATLHVDAGSVSGPNRPVDQIHDWLNRAVAATNFDPRNLSEGVSGAPVWLTKAAANGLLRVVRAAYLGGRNLSEAIAHGVEWLRAQNLADFSEKDARDWLARSVTEARGALNIRGFQDQLDAESAATGNPLADQVGNLLYDRRTNEGDAAFAARVMDAVGGPDAAMKVFNDPANALPGSARMMLGQLIIKRLSALGRNADAVTFYDQEFSRHVTDVAQSLQSLNAWLALTPEGQVVWAKRNIERAAADKVKPVQKDLAQAQTELQQANADGIQQTTAAPEVQTVARQAVDGALDQQAGTLGTDLQEAVRNHVLDEMVQAGLITAREAEITKLHFEGGGGSLEDKLSSAGLADTAKRAKKLLEEYQARTKAAREKLKQQAADARRNPDPTNDTTLTTAVRQEMKRQQVNLGRVVHQHFTAVDATGKALADKLVEQAGLTGDAAQKLADAVLRKFSQLVTTRKQAVLQRLLNPAKRLGIVRKGMAERLIEATNVGAFSDKQFWDAVREKLDLPAWSPELAERLQKMAEQTGRIPEGEVSRRQEAQQRLVNEVTKVTGFTPFDAAHAFYVTNLISGLTTHFKVALHTATSLLASMGSEIARSVAGGHLADIPLIFEAAARGFRNSTAEQVDIMRTGMQTGGRVSTIFPQRLHELARYGERGGVPIPGQGVGARVTRAILENRLAKILNLWKFNDRLVKAQHVLYLMPAEEMKAALLTARLQRDAGLRGRAAVDEARRILGYGQDAVDAARAQATGEGYTGLKLTKRVGELLESRRPEEVRESALDYARRVAFLKNYGVLGTLVDWFGQGRRSDSAVVSGAVKFLTPFTKIAAGLANEGLNYTPVGAGRALFARTEMVGNHLADLTPAQTKDLRGELYTKAALGTAVGIGIAAKSLAQLGSANPSFAIYGSGPAGNEDKDRWRTVGAIPWSLKVGDHYYSYANTPGNILLAALGNYADRLRDAVLYNRSQAKRVQDDLSLRLAVAALGSAQVMLQMPFLASLTEVAGLGSEPNPEVAGRKVQQLVVRTGSSVVVPNLLRQVDRIFDDQVYSQRDLEGMLVRAVPFAQTAVPQQPVLNVLGEPVRSPIQRQFTSPTEMDAAVKKLNQYGVWPSKPARNSTLVDGAPLTDDEFYQFTKARGQQLARIVNTPDFDGAMAGLDAALQRLEAAAATATPLRQQQLQTQETKVQAKTMEIVDALATAKARVTIRQLRAANGVR